MAAAVARVLQFAITVPAGTALAVPLVTPCQLDATVLEWVEVRMPPGPAGFVGFWVSSSGQQVLPFTVGSTPDPLVLDGEVVHWDLDAMPDSGDFSVSAYNTGRYPHTIYVRFGVNDTVDANAAAGRAAPGPLALASISNPAPTA